MSTTTVEVIEVITNVVVGNPTSEVTVLQSPTISVVEVGVGGPQGPPGVSTFSGSTPYYTQTISVPSSDWVVPHALGYIPNITVLIGGTVVLAEVYSTTVQTTVHFNTPQVGQVVAS